MTLIRFRGSRQLFKLSLVYFFKIQRICIHGSKRQPVSLSRLRLYALKSFKVNVFNQVNYKIASCSKNSNEIKVHDLKDQLLVKSFEGPQISRTRGTSRCFIICYISSQPNKANGHTWAKSQEQTACYLSIYFLGVLQILKSSIFLLDSSQNIALA